MRVEKNGILRSGYECYCCCCRVCLCSVLYGSHAKADNRRHRGALCSACVGRAVRCLWRGHTPQSPEHDYFFRWPLASAAKEKQQTEHPRRMLQQAVVYTALGGVIDVASAPPPHDFACLRGGLALAWPRHTGHAFGRRDSSLVWRNHLPCELASFSLVLYAVHTYKT